MQAQLGRNSHTRWLAGRKMDLCVCPQPLFHQRQACCAAFQALLNAKINHHHSFKEEPCAGGF